MKKYTIINSAKEIKVKSEIPAEEVKEWIFNKLSKNNFKESVLWDYILTNNENDDIVSIEKSMVIN